jgi:formylglycine-generating enzyme required for sulfatase activity
LSPDAAFKARQLSKEIRGELDWITMKALEKDPRRRYSSASDLASDIACYLKGEAVIAGPPSKAYRLRKFAWKHRGKLLAAAAALMVAAYPTFSYVREIARARGLMAEARGSCEAYMGLAREAEALYLEWRESRNRLPAWAPVWERSEELDAWRRLLGLIGRIQPAHVAAVGAVGRAFEADLGTRVRADLAGRLEEVVAVHFTGASGGKLALGELQKELPGPVPGGERALGGTPSAVSLQSDPAGAEVYCFRFEEREARWMPLPFDPRLGRDDPAKGVREIDYLLVDRLWPRQGDGSSPPFATGDRLVTVNGEVVRSFGDLARVLTNVKGDHPAEVEILREGDKKTARWVPWLASRAEWMRKALEHYGRPVDQVLPGRLVDPALQLGVTFAAYPLDCSPANLLGTTGPGKLLEFEVPAGSYLFILRRPGHEDVRLPIVARERVIRETVRLPEATAVPKGFIYIPAGTAATGGDPKADQSFEWDYVPVGAFFISKFELSSVEWLEFLNDERILAGIGEEEGRAPPRSPQVIGELGGLGVKDVQLVPKSGKNLYLEKAADGRWAFSDADRGHYNAFWTALHVSHHAALEYVHWRNEVAEERREPWVYRLPTDLEWERAARGADRRHFAWSLCRSQQGVLVAQPGPSGSVPFDESVFGVRDLTGSVREHTSGNPFGRFRTTRGGNFDDVSDVYFRLASRNGFLPHNWDAGLGVRLVAEPRR